MRGEIAVVVNSKVSLDLSMNANDTYLVSLVNNDSHFEVQLVIN